jgi:hypothetical protein
MDGATGREENLMRTEEATNLIRAHEDLSKFFWVLEVYSP